jgi:pimeloyl-ACP methyl ester carboxylesterase
MPVQSHVAISADGVPIHYDVQGNGATALVFVHGWCCNRRFWDPQVEHFAPHYTVVSLDLAGHGASGRDRTQWTVPAFGQDIVAVVKQQGLDQVVLIGHSMGGSWIVEAAPHLPRAVIGVVGVDTWPNTEQSPTPAQAAETLAPFRTNFVEAMRAFVRTLFVPTSDPALIEHVVATMSAGPPPVAIGAREAVLGNVPALQVHIPRISATQSTGRLPPNPHEACHPIHGKVATQSTAKLPPHPGHACHHRSAATPGGLCLRYWDVACQPKLSSLVKIRLSAGPPGDDPLR